MAAENAREYYLAHARQTKAPSQLSRSEREHYRDVFAAIDAKDWTKAAALLKERDDGLLQAVATAEFYLAAGSPKVELPQIQAWMEKGRNLPEAAQLARLAMTRGATAMPALPQEQAFYSTGGPPRRVRPRSIDDGTMPAEIRMQILDRIDQDDPDGARLLLDGVDATLSTDARAEWRQRIAWSYYIENQDAAALALARTVAAGSGPWVAEGEWTAGLAAWRLNDCDTAGAAFERAADKANNPELAAAAWYWAHRAALRCRDTERGVALLRAAARNDETLYGMLAAQQLGTALPRRFANAELSDADWERLKRHDNVRIAVALAEIGRDELASQVLLQQAKIGDVGDYAALSRLARDIGLPATQLYMAYNAPSGGRADPAAYYPAPKWAPSNGWLVDPALAFAHTLQESNFQEKAVSPANAKGLMQITPITVREHAPALGLSASSVDVTEPRVNLAFGQRNLEMLRDAPATEGELPKIMAAYNAGLSPVTRWQSEVRDGGDPLLWMESIPYWETRSYVAIVMRNYWMYERQAGAASSSRAALAANAWPMFPGEKSSSGRVYLDARAGD
ncbi:MAG TPA: lytic transglycosylase domain-containing protein [Croceibacterium sp.]|nr:lytic transglycosylase domain-containing protein [Croceibacterium sp.]